MITQVKVRACVTKSYQYKSFTCDLESLVTIAEEKNAKGVMSKLYSQLVVMCNKEVDAQIALCKQGVNKEVEKQLAKDLDEEIDDGFAKK